MYRKLFNWALGNGLKFGEADFKNKFETEKKIVSKNKFTYLEFEHSEFEDVMNDFLVKNPNIKIESHTVSYRNNDMDSSNPLVTMTIFYS
jgi:hypothetical protein